MDPQLAGVLPEKLCRDHHFVPVEIRDDTLDVAFSTFEDMLMTDELQLLTGMNIRPMMAPMSVVEKAQETLFLATRTKFISRLNDFAGEEEEEDDEPEPEEEQEDESVLAIDAPAPAGPDGRVIRMVNQILQDAMRMGASDIHLEPFEDSCAVRLRVDGELRALTPPTKVQFVPIDLALQDSGENGHRREAHPPGRRHRLARRRRSGSTSASAPSPPSTARRWSCVFSTRAPFPSS